MALDVNQNDEFVVLCPHCEGKIGTNGRALGCLLPCPHCKREIAYNIVQKNDGGLAVYYIGRPEMHDLAAAVIISSMKLKKYKCGEIDDAALKKAVDMVEIRPAASGTVSAAKSLFKSFFRK